MSGNESTTIALVFTSTFVVVGHRAVLHLGGGRKTPPRRQGQKEKCDAELRQQNSRHGQKLSFFSAPHKVPLLLLRGQKKKGRAVGAMQDDAKKRNKLIKARLKAVRRSNSSSRWQPADEEEDTEDDAWGEMKAMQRDATRQNSDQRIAEKLRSWHASRRSEYGMHEIDTTHKCSSEGCLRAGAIHLIDDELQLYGCDKGGVHHVCKAKTGLCHQYYLGGDGSYFCLFSRLWLAQGVARSYFDRGDDKHEGDTQQDKVNGEEDEEEGYGGAEDARSDSDGGGGDVDCEEMTLSEPPPLERLGAGEGAAGERFGMAIVTHESRAAAAPLVPVPEFTVKLGTGGSSTRGKYKTGVAVAAPVVRRRRQRAVDSKAQIRVHGVIAPLFNKSQRRALSEKHHTSMEKSAQQQIHKYIRACAQAGTRPDIHARDAIYERCMTKRRLLLFEDTDNAVLLRYVALAFETWKIIVDSPRFVTHHAEFRLNEHVLGVLYTTMSVGVCMLSSDGITSRVIIPQDIYLAEMLPAQSQLSDWKSINPCYCGRSITNGRNTFKVALNSIVDDDARAHAETRIKEAYYNGTITGGVQAFKIGEKKA